MKVPFSWLKEFIDPDTSAQELARRLTMAGLEAEKLEEIGADWERVYVGLISEVTQHPNADRLRLAVVEAGEHNLTVVTGAPNIFPGQKVALALTGASLIDGHSESGQRKVLKPVNMRGIMSEGMVCSERELGLSNEHEGILQLPDDAPVGTLLRDYLGDTVIEFEITPNLVHDFSVHGIARETHVLTGNPVSLPPLHDLSPDLQSSADLVTIEDSDRCPRYMAVVIENVVVTDSPSWLSSRLAAAGLRSINNIVDVTNYVMLEFGQPLHAFDAALLSEGRIVVRRANDGEKLETLDRVNRTLDADMLVIADATKPVAVAGLMGGFESEVTEQTSTILLEAANFEMKGVRRTSRTLKLRTDASTRFERGLDPELVTLAMRRATEMILSVAPGAILKTWTDNYPSPAKTRSLRMPFSRIARVLGISIPDTTVLEILARLEFSPKIEGDPDDLYLLVTIPTYRHDVSLPEDIVEEVARIVGYDQLPYTLPRGATMPITRDPIFQLQKELRGTLTGAGLFEAVTYLTTSEAAMLGFLQGDASLGGLLSTLPIADSVRLINPIQSERGLLRTTLIPSLLEVVAQNLRHQPTVQFFEMSRTYEPTSRNELPLERNLLGIVLAGQRERLSRFGSTDLLDFFDLKGIVELLMTQLTGSPATFVPFEHPALHPGRAAEVIVSQERIAIIGELRPEVIDAFGIDMLRVPVAELDLDRLNAMTTAAPVQVTTARYLPVTQDFAVVVEAAVPADVVRNALLKGAGPLVTDAVLFDVYEGAQIPTGKKSLAFRVTFQSPETALTDAELVAVRGKIERTIKHLVSGQLRT